jgi:hypothetical protein
MRVVRGSDVPQRPAPSAYEFKLERARIDSVAAWKRKLPPAFRARAGCPGYVPGHSRLESC